MKQLLTQLDILDIETYLTQESDSHNQVPPDELDLPTDQEKIHWEGLEKVELVSIVENLMEEASRTNLIIRSLQQDKDLIIQPREVFALAFRLANKLIVLKQRKAELTRHSQSVNAHSDTIDEHWEQVCQGSEDWRK